MERQIALEELSVVLELPLDAIDETKSFVGCGGHSITALQFAARCMERQVSVAIDSILTSHTIKDLLDLCQTREHDVLVEPNNLKPISDIDILSSPHGTSTTSLSPLKDDIADYHSQKSDSSVSSLHSSGGPSDEEYSTLATTNGSGTLPSNPVKIAGTDWRAICLETEDLCDPLHVPDELGELTEIQLSLIHGSIKEPGSNIIRYYETYDADQVPLIKSAWKQVLRNEPIFRTIYRNPEDGCWLIPKFHWREYETTNRRKYREIIDGDESTLPIWPGSTRPEIIDLSNRFTIITLSREAGESNISNIIWSIHHALIDGWSATSLLHKVRQAASGIPVTVGASFRDLTSSLEDLRKARKVEGDGFWNSKSSILAEAQGKMLLHPPLKTSEDERKYPFREIRLSLRRHWNKLEQTARSCGVTLATILHAAWATTLSVYTDSENVVFGAIVSGRNLPLPGAFEAIGPLVNTLPLHVTVFRTQTARDLLANVFHELQQLSRFSWTTPDNGFSRSFESVFAMQLEPDNNNVSSATVKPIKPSFSRQTTNIPISVIHSGRGQITLQFSTSQYRHEHMRDVARCFRDAVVALTRLDMRLDKCIASLLSTKSLATLRRLGNCESGWTTRASSSDDLVTLFEAAASKHPEEIAIDAAGQKLSYAELEQASRVLASEIAHRISPQEIIPIHADGSVNWIIAIWAVLRAGGAYCPIDQDHPQAVRDSMFTACEARYFIATSKEACETKCPNGAFIIDVTAALQAKSGLETTANMPVCRRESPRPWDRAYVCFTSGSTGKPKGVVCTHGGLVAFQRDLEVRLYAQPGRRVAQFMSVAFDGSIHEVFSSLCYGATLVLRNGREPLGHLRSAHSAILTPSIAAHLNPADFPLLETVYLVGEAVSQSVCDRWASSKSLFNMYGPTEATCGATIARLLPGRPVTIGKPNPSTRVYILDRHQQLAPIGRVGEIWLAGVQVSQGYIGQPELTAERFSPDTICSGLGEFMYRTGDHGYWNEEGEIVFLGRSDRIVKIRGFRLDLDDLETRILRCCTDARAVAVACRDKTDLVCMIETQSRDVAQIQSNIASELPTYSIPRYIVPVDRLPITGTGKIDYKVVSQSAASNAPSRREDELVTATEIKLAAIWADVLDIIGNEVIKASSAFVDLGGHSLRQLRLVSRLKADFNVPINLRMIIHLPTLRELAREIDKQLQQRSLSEPLVTCQGQPLERFKPSPAERHWWQRYQWDHGLASFNVSFVCKYDAELVNQEKIVKAWNHVLARHEIFRSRYIHHRKRGLERILVSYPPVVQTLEDVDVWSELNTPFALEATSPVRVVITRDTIVAMWSHIVCDYSTLSMLLAEVAAVYRDEDLQLEIHKYHETAVWSSIAPPCSLEFWSRYLKGVPQTQPACLGNLNQRSSYRGTSTTVRVEPSLWHSMQAYIEDGQYTAQQVVLAATALALSSESDSIDITLGVPFMNRRSEADMHTVGLFLEPLPIRIAFCGAPGNQDSILPPLPATAGDFVSAVQLLAQRALANAIPWSQLLDALGTKEEELLPDNPIFDCVVSFHDMRTTSSKVSGAVGAWNQLDLGAGVQPQLVWSEGSKFKLMVEFIALSNDSLVLRLEFDDTSYDGLKHIVAIRRMILRALEAVIGNSEIKDEVLEDTRESLKQAWLVEKSANFDSGDKSGAIKACADGLFQKSLSEI